MILVIKNGICDTDIINIIKYIDNSINIDMIYSNKLTKKKCYDIMTKYNAIIILGGHQSLVNRHQKDYPYKYINNLIEFTKIWIENNIYVLGICLGSQIIGEAIGCNTLSIGYNIAGYQQNIKLHILNDDITKNNVSNMLNYIISNHNDYVKINNKNIIVIASLETKNKDIIPYIFKYKNIYGLQFHPEITINILKIIKNTYLTFDIDTINYAKKNIDIIKQTSYTLLKNWLDIINN